VSDRSANKALTFGVNALYTAVAGVPGAITVQFAAPDSFTVQLSTNLLVDSWSVGRLDSWALFGCTFVLSRSIWPSKSPKDYSMQPC
jgi:branched-chain amino acid transport system permease protein